MAADRDDEMQTDADERTSAAPEPDDPEQPANLFTMIAEVRSLGPAAILGVVWGILPLVGGFVLLWRIGDVDAWLGGMDPMVAGAVFASILAITSGFGLLPTYAQAVLAGWALGPVMGTVWAETGIIGGALIGMGISRTVGKAQFEAAIEEKPKWAAIRRALVDSSPLRTLGLVTLIRVPPNSPFSLTNLVLTVSGVPLWTYIVGTAVGILPRTALVVSLGHGLRLALKEAGTADTLTGEAVKEIDKPWWLFAGGIAVVLAVIFIISRIAEQAIASMTAGEADDDAPEPAA